MYSITPYEDYLADPLRLFPPEVTFTAYKELFTFPLMKTGYFSTIFVTVVGTAPQHLFALHHRLPALQAQS